MLNTKDSIYLRKKKLANGKTSLYLDVYSNGIRKYEFLKLYLIPETNRQSRQQNKETLRIAEQMRIQRLAEVQMNPLSKYPVNNVSLYGFAEKYISTKKKSTASTYTNVLKLIERHFGRDFQICNLDEDNIKEFFSFIGSVKSKTNPNKNLSGTTQHHYCVIFNTILRNAADEKLLSYDISKGIKITKIDVKAKQYLSIEEVQKLVNTDLRRPYRRAFLFSCFTGMRKSDVIAMTWGCVIEQDGFTRIIFNQKKTESVEYLDISPQARKLMGCRGNDYERVFNELGKTWNTNRAIKKWIESVGIHKKITFHCARHTFAVMMLTLDVDIFTVSKLLGHKDIETTQIYAKIVDKKKQEAVTKIPIIILVYTFTYEEETNQEEYALQEVGFFQECLEYGLHQRLWLCGESVRDRIHKWLGFSILQYSYSRLDIRATVS